MLDRGMGSIKKQLKRLVRKGEMAEAVAEEVTARVRPETTLDVSGRVELGFRMRLRG
jgi:3-hydroxyacyl-CoA dehydrogenase